MAYSSASGHTGSSWNPRPPHFQMYGPPPGPQPSGALAIVGFIISLIAFLCGWVPFLGLGLGTVGLLLSILAAPKQTRRGLAGLPGDHGPVPPRPPGQLGPHAG